MKVYDKEIYNKQESIKTIVVGTIITLMVCKPLLVYTKKGM